MNIPSEKSNDKETMADFILLACSVGLSVAGGCAYAWKLAGAHLRYFFQPNRDIVLTGTNAEHYGMALIAAGIASGIIPFKNYFLHSLGIENFSKIKKAVVYLLIGVALALPGYFPILMTNLSNKESPEQEEERHHEYIFGDYQKILTRDFLNDVNYLPHEKVIKKIQTTIEWNYLPAFQAEINVLRKKGVSNLSPQEAELWLALNEQIKIIRAKKH